MTIWPCGRRRLVTRWPKPRAAGEPDRRRAPGDRPLAEHHALEKNWGFTAVRRRCFFNRLHGHVGVTAHWLRRGIVLQTGSTMPRVDGHASPARACCATGTTMPTMRSAWRSRRARACDDCTDGCSAWTVMLRHWRIWRALRSDTRPGCWWMTHTPGVLGAQAAARWAGSCSMRGRAIAGGHAGKAFGSSAPSWRRPRCHALISSVRAATVHHGVAPRWLGDRAALALRA